MSLPTIGRQRPAKRIEVPAYPPTAKETEGLTGYVHGLEASELEERFAKSLTRHGLTFQFQYEVLTMAGIPGEENVVDFVVETGQPYPVEIDGNWIHKSAAQREKDRLRDAQVNEVLQNWGFLPILRIPGDQIADPEHTDAIVEEYIL